MLGFGPGLFLTSTPSLTELDGISVNSNLSEKHYFSLSFHWKVSRTQEKLYQRKVVPKIYSTT